jgi:hypothetical protein
MTNSVLEDLEESVVSFKLSTDKKTVTITEETDDLGFTYVVNRVQMSQLIEELIELRDQMKPI